MIRAFVGLALPREIAHHLDALQAGLPVGRAVDAESLHITLAYLGENPRPVVEDVHFALETLRAERFALRLQGLGFFGGERPTNFHAVVAPDPGLSHLRRKVLQATRDAGLRLKSERYSPHVTLARFSRGLAPDQTAEMAAFAEGIGRIDLGPFAVEQFTLFRSRLGREGARYEALAEYPLG